MLKVLRHYKMVRQPQNGALFLGIHEEGPYLSVEYKALMDERYLRDPSSSELDEMLEACGHRIITMTVAPERHGMDQFIPYLKKRNISVMIGHSAATSGDVQRALNNQADGFTHLYNACSQHLHRDPGVVTGAFLDDRSYCELICDGFHVHEDIIKMSYKYLTSRRIVLITDAMLGKGMPDGEFIFSNLLCQKEGTHVWVKATGRRAGSAFGMIDAVRFMLKTVNCTLNDIVQMACVNPAVLAKVADKKGRLAVGMDADICVMDQKQQILHTIIGSRIVYSRD
ncbi:N-acetylglucosamine-6-phosphate deacetylase [bioreactor metagenome]|uniref:N-acetylglucosamine-6-phosphate deacetylase n=1 Tax=bioreactor metagenome TaxID=1076179 RepID=A0A645ASP5_9ZZZZ